MTRFALIQRLSIAALGLMLTACTGVTVAPPATASPSAPPATPTQTPSPITASPVTESSSQPTATALLATETPPPTEAAALFNGIQQGDTIDGFPYLGDPAAPVTLTDYSDFL